MAQDLEPASGCGRPQEEHAGLPGCGRPAGGLVGLLHCNTCCWSAAGGLTNEAARPCHAAGSLERTTASDVSSRWGGLSGEASERWSDGIPGQGMRCHEIVFFSRAVNPRMGDCWVPRAEGRPSSGAHCSAAQCCQVQKHLYCGQTPAKPVAAAPQLETTRPTTLPYSMEHLHRYSVLPWNSL